MLNVMAEQAAIAALSESGLTWMRSHAALARTVRDQFLTDLRSLGLSPLSSDANFVFIPLADARAVAAHMKARDVVVRAFDNLPQTIPAFAACGGSGLRIGIGPAEAMTCCLGALVAALDEARACA